MQGRDTTIDGFRALAALGVVFSHAVLYRFSEAAFFGEHYLRRLADPLAQTSVQVFFVISGYIITMLLLKEEKASGRFSLTAFFIRRICRILPPLLTLLTVILMMESLSLIKIGDQSLIAAATFTCNLGIVECEWWVAHTWSLSVEEQFYILWPFAVLLVPKRPIFLVGIIISLLLMFFITPFVWHSNFISFTCIGLGALYASSAPLRDKLEGAANYWFWVLATFALMLGPLFVPLKPMQALMPFLILYVVFAARMLVSARAFLGHKLLQLIGLASYSLYLWQQIFLAKPHLYLKTPFPLWLLPIVVLASVLIIELPFIRLGRYLSGRILESSRTQLANSAPASSHSKP